MKADDGKKVWQRKILSLILTMFLLFCIYQIFLLFPKYINVRESYEEIKEKNEEIKQKKESIEKQVKILESEEGLELEIRKNLPVIKEGEEVIFIVE